MKKIIFNLLTSISLVSFIFAALLFYIFFTEESPGMIMAFLIPSLISGLLFGAVALALKKNQTIVLDTFSSGLYKSNLVSMFLGAIALIYSFLN